LANLLKCYDNTKCFCRWRSVWLDRYQFNCQSHYCVTLQLPQFCRCSLVSLSEPSNGPPRHFELTIRKMESL
jgi:hypothetical protein